VTLTLQALNKVPGPIFEVRPVLAVRCREGELNVIVTTGAVLDAEDDLTPVRLRWGSDPPEDEHWTRSTDYSAAFAPEPEVFIAELLNFPDLKFEFHPFDATPRVASFNARGLARHLPTLRRACPSLAQQTDKPAQGITSGDTAVIGRYLATVRRDLANLVFAQEGYYASNHHYAKSLHALGTQAPTGFRPAAGVTVTLDEATNETYRARATHASAPGWTCAIYFGDTQPYVREQKSGVSACWKGEAPQ
jgi:hypothetical protein